MARPITHRHVLQPATVQEPLEPEVCHATKAILGSYKGPAYSGTLSWDEGSADARRLTSAERAGRPFNEREPRFIAAFRELIESRNYADLRDRDYAGAWFAPRIDKRTASREIFGVNAATHMRQSAI